MPTIEQNLERLVTAKDNIAAAIKAKGGTAPTGDGLEEYPADISTIAPYEMTGELPLTFKSDGENLRDYIIYGNAQGIGIDDGKGGYIIPIKINNTVINLPTASKLYTDDTLTYADTQTAIPTVNGVNVIDTTLENKPSMFVQYGNFPIYDNINAAINTLKGTDTTYKPADMADEILDAIPDVEVSGSVVSITDAAKYAAEKLEFRVEPVQSGSGDPSPTNVRPISGWTGVNGKHSGADATQYTEILITFPTEAGIVYGCKVDVVNGKLTVTKAMGDFGNLFWNYRNDGGNLAPYFWCYTELAANFPSGNIKYAGPWATTVQNAICTGYPIVKRNITDFIDKTATFDGGNANTSQLQIKNSDYTDAQTFKTAMDGIKLVYELATPIEYDITPQQVQMLLGDNNIWCDTGDTTVKYKVDLGRYIAGLQAAQNRTVSLTRSAAPVELTEEPVQIEEPVESVEDER